jgi:hypothetical protein
LGTGERSNRSFSLSDRKSLIAALTVFGSPTSQAAFKAVSASWANAPRPLNGPLWRKSRSSSPSLAHRDLCTRAVSEMHANWSDFCGSLSVGWCHFNQETKQYTRLEDAPSRSAANLNLATASQRIHYVEAAKHGSVYYGNEHALAAARDIDLTIELSLLRGESDGIAVSSYSAFS